MEALYAKLYEKYNSLKKNRLSELDDLNRDQEVKFLNYVSVAEDLMHHLKEENDSLRSQIADLRSELTSTRSAKDEKCAEYQELLTDANHKNKLLSDEIERLQKLVREGQACSSKDGKNGNVHLDVSETPHVAPRKVSNGSTRTARTTRKRAREAMNKIELGVTTTMSSGQDDEMARALSKDLLERTASAKGFSGDPSIDQQVECHKRTVDKSGDSAVHDCGTSNCQFQALIEYLVGLKLSTAKQAEGICISAIHQSSGYSFSLTWVEKAGEEPELLYRASTLGTFERVAPEWMRSMLMFSMSMCPIFFERVARVIKMHH